MLNLGATERGIGDGSLERKLPGTLLNPLLNPPATIADDMDIADGVVPREDKASCDDIALDDRETPCTQNLFVYT